MIEQQATPCIEMKTFDGNPLKYHPFVDLFRETVEKSIQDPKRKLQLIEIHKGRSSRSNQALSIGSILHWLFQYSRITQKKV